MTQDEGVFVLSLEKKGTCSKKFCLYSQIA